MSMKNLLKNKKISLIRKASQITGKPFLLFVIINKIILAI